jgi:flagellar motor switch protein FliG
MVEQYEEEIAAMAVLKPEDGEDAQRTLVGVVRRLVAAGTIKLNPHTDDAA